MKLDKILSQPVNGLSVFAGALAVRLVFCLSMAPRQLCGLNDRPNLDLAMLLSNAFNSANLGMSQTHDLFERGTLMDSLIQRGPVYPFFLAGLNRLFNVAPHTDLSTLNCTNFVIVNCLVSALACVCIYYAARFAFNRRSAVIAATLAILYPAGIVNCLQCYPECLCFMLVSLFLALVSAALLRHRLEFWDLPLFFLSGVVAALIMFCVPLLFGLPIAITFALVAYRYGQPLLRLVGSSPPPAAAPAKTGDGAGDTARATGDGTSDTANAAADGTSGTARAAGDGNSDTANAVADASGGVTSQPAVGFKLTTPPHWQNSLRLLSSVIAAAAGVAFVFAPWIRLQQVCTAQFEILPLSSLASPLWMGNLLASSGWEALPVSDFLASNLSGTARILLKSIVLAPVPHFLLLMQKIPRLWAGCWNDFGSSVFGVTGGAANNFHCLLLAGAYLGFSLATLSYTRWRLSRSLPGATMFAIVVVYHFLYCMLSPMARNCYTAMPAVIILAGFGLERLGCAAQSSRKAAVVPVGVAVLLFGFLATDNLVSFLFPYTHSEFLSKLGWLVFALLGWLALFRLTLRVVEKQAGAKVSLASDMLKLACFGVIVVTVSCSITDQRWREWSTVLTDSHREVDQKESIPSLAELPGVANKADNSGTAFILIDAASAGTAPMITASVNGIPAMAPPCPWIRVRPLNLEGFADIKAQASGIGCDWRSMRQWWAMPVPLWALKFGEVNDIKVTLQPLGDRSSCAIFGQYGEQIVSGSGSSLIMPSPYTVSWQKGFGTYESGDIRVIEPVALSGILGAVKTTHSYNVKPAEGVEPAPTQLEDFAGYRIRLAVPVRIGFASVPGESGEPEKGLKQVPQPYRRDDEMEITADEKSQMLIPPLSSWSEALSRRCLLDFQCEIKAPTKDTNGRLMLKLTGTNDLMQPVSYLSPWQPDTFAVADRWQQFRWVETVPDNMAHLNNLSVSVSMRPYEEAEALAHPSRVKDKKISVRHVSLTALPAMDLPFERDRDWIIF